jgi:hypothetical protein
MADTQSQQEGPFKTLLFEDFTGGLDTNSSRPGVAENALAWCDGFMPVGRNNLRAIPDLSGSIFTAPGGTTILWYGFGNVGPAPTVPYCVAVLSNGAVWKIRTDTNTATQVFPAGTITTTRPNIGLTQFGNAFMILVAIQANGYYIIDNTLGYGPGTLAPGVELTDGGSGYTAPTATATGGSGTGATFTVQSAGGVITGVTMTSSGAGYIPGDMPTIVFGGGGTGATATVSLMPFAVFGSSAEVYQSRVWAVAGPNCFFTAPESATDFSTANGGGLFTSNDSFLRASYTRLIQTNGFLYFIADSSINYVGGVTTSGDPPVTTFTNQNADPEVGTPYPDTVCVLSSNTVFANLFGAQVGYGGRVAKVSEALDGIYNTVYQFGGFLPSAGKAILYGKRCWVLLIPVLDPVSNVQVNKLFMWDEKRWWSTQQGVPLVFIASQELNSQLSTWGTDGTNIYLLFSSPSVAITRVAISKFWTEPGGYMQLKAANRIWLIAEFNSANSPAIIFAVDNEINASSVTLTPTGAFTTGFWVSPPTAIGQSGAMLGIALRTNAQDVTIVSAACDAVPVGYRG